MRKFAFCLAAMLLLIAPASADFYCGFESAQGFDSSPSMYLNDNSSVTGFYTSDTTSSSYQVWAGPPGTYPSGGAAPTSGYTGISPYQGTQSCVWKGSYGRSAYHNMGTNSPSHHFHVQVAMVKKDGVGDFWCATQRGTDTSTRSSGFGFHGNQIGYYSNGVWVNSGGTITPYTWYLFDVYVDTYAGTFSAYVTPWGGSQYMIANNVPSWSVGSGASDTVYFWRSSGGGHAAIDGLHCWLYDCVNICQVNIRAGGRFDVNDHDLANYGTSAAFAQWVAQVPPTLYNWYPPIAVIAVQETFTNYAMSTLEANLEAQTGVNWDYYHASGGLNNGQNGPAIFWRPDIVTDMGSLGEVVLDYLDTDSGPDTYVLKAIGRLFQKTGSWEMIGVFSGKTAWDSAVLNGHTVTDQDRINEANTLKNWIVNTAMYNYCWTPRIVCADMSGATNATMDAIFADQGNQNTIAPNWGTMSDSTLDANGAKLDHTWWDWDCTGTEAAGGFCLTPKRSTYFGSDHRAVWAYVKMH